MAIPTPTTGLRSSTNPAAIPPMRASYRGRGAVVERGRVSHAGQGPKTVRISSKRRIMKVGFIGLGSMGTPMARNLIKAGHSLTVYNRTRHRAEELERDGGRVASSPSEAARDADALVTMLSDDA